MTFNHFHPYKMKQFIFLAATGLMALAACHEFAGPEKRTDEGVLLVSVSSGAATTSTKAETSPSGKDADLRDIQLFLFSADGSLYRREVFSAQQTSKSLARIKAGAYDVVAVANAPALSGIGSRTELEQAEITLGLNQSDQGFLMMGQTASAVTVKGGTAAPARAEITVRRHVGRVRLTSVENGLPAAYGVLDVECVFLENGFGTWNYGGTGDPSAYVNYAGRKAGRNTSSDPSDFIVNQSDALYADLTFRMLDRPVAPGGRETFDVPFYSFPNKHTAVTDHFSGATSEDACARLVLKASYGAAGKQSWYYPVTIENLERNKTYDVSFIIRGPGSPDPNKKLESGSLEVVIAVEPWEDGGDFIGDF